MKKFYIGYHNKPYDKSDFTIMAETENQNVAFSIKELYTEAYKKNGFGTELTIYESRELPKNAHY